MENKFNSFLNEYFFSRGEGVTLITWEPGSEEERNSYVNVMKNYCNLAA